MLCGPSKRTALPELLPSSPESPPGGAGRAYSSMRTMTSSLDHEPEGLAAGIVEVRVSITGQNYLLCGGVSL